MALVLFLRSSVIVMWSDHMGQKICGITSGGDKAKSWKVRTERDFRNRGPPAN